MADNVSQHIYRISSFYFAVTNNLMAFGIVGNLLVISVYVYNSKVREKVGNIFVFALAIADVEGEKKGHIYDDFKRTVFKRV